MVDQSSVVELLKKEDFFIIKIIHKKGSVWYYYAPNLPVFASNK